MKKILICSALFLSLPLQICAEGKVKKSKPSHLETIGNKIRSHAKVICGVLVCGALCGAGWYCWRYSAQRPANPVPPHPEGQGNQVPPVAPPFIQLNHDPEILNRPAQVGNGQPFGMNANLPPNVAWQQWRHQQLLNQNQYILNQNLRLQNQLLSQAAQQSRPQVLPHGVHGVAPVQQQQSVPVVKPLHVPFSPNNHIPGYNILNARARGMNTCPLNLAQNN